MNREQFLELMGSTYDELIEMNKTKGADYAGDEDVISNFRRNADALGLKPEQVWAVYAGKHWDSIQTYCREGDVASEPIEGRVKDLILYGFLLLAMVRDRIRVHANRIGPPEPEACGKSTQQAGTDGFCTRPRGHEGACVEALQRGGRVEIP